MPLLPASKPLAHLLMCTLLFIFSEDLPRDLHWQQRPTLPHAESDWISFGGVGDNDYFGFMAACDGHLQILQWWQVSCNLYACGIEIQFAFIVACVLGKMQLSFFYCLLGLNPAKVPSKCNGERQNAIMTSRPLEGNWLRFASRRFLSPWSKDTSFSPTSSTLSPASIHQWLGLRTVWPLIFSWVRWKRRKSSPLGVP